MKLEDVIERSLIFHPNEVLSKVLYKMLSENKYEALIFDKDLKGIISLDDIAKKILSEPEKVKISNFVRPIVTFSLETPIEDIINYIVVSEYRSVPIKKGDEIFILPKNKILKIIKKDVFENKKVSEFMRSSICVKKDDTLSRIASIFRNVNIDRIPVVDEKGVCIGLIDSMSIVSLIVDREREKFGERRGEKLKLGEIKIDKFIKTNITKVDPNDSLKKAVNLIINEPSHTLIVEGENKFLGILTIKDILKLLRKPAENVYIRISGLDEEDEFIKEKVNEMIENSISKLMKSVKISYISLHIEKRKKSKIGRVRYFVSGRFSTEKGIYYAKSNEWDLTKSIKIFIEKIEREIYKKMEKHKGY